MEEASTRIVDAYGTRIVVSDYVTLLNDPHRPVIVVGVADNGRLTVLHGPDEHVIPARLVRVVTVRDSAGVPLAQGDIVRGVGQPGNDPATRVVAAVLYGPHLVVLAADGQHPEQTTVAPVLLVRVGAALSAGDQVLDDVTGRMFVVFGEVDGDPGRLVVEPLHGGERRDVPRAHLRRAAEVEYGLSVASDGSFAVPALGDDMAALGRQLLGECAMTGNVVPLPRVASN